MHSIWRVFRYLKYYPKEIVLVLLFNALHVFFNLFSYALIVPFVELLFGLSAPQTSAPELSFDQEHVTEWMLWELYSLKELYGVWKCMIVVSCGYVACSFLSNLSRYLGMYFVGPIRHGVVRRLRDDVYEKMTILPVSYFNSRRRGDILSRMSNDLSDVEWSVVTSVLSVAKDPINIILFSATLIFISPRLFFYFLLVLPVSVFLIVMIGKSLKRNSTKGQTKLGQLFSVLEESLEGVKAVKSFGREADRVKRFEAANDDYARTMVRVARRRELGAPLSEVLGTIGLVAILVIGGSLVLRGELISSVFIFFVIVFARLIPPVQSVVRAYNNLQKGNASAIRFFEILDADEKIIEQPNAISIDSFKESVTYRDVSFSYTPDDGNPVKVLDHVSFTIPRGKMVAIVGPSGAGKTTLVDLLPRFYDCDEGEILVDGIPVRQLNIASLRRQVSLVSQNCILFNDTIQKNIAFGHDDYSLEAVRAAAKVANAAEFIDQLPQGYDTPIGDRGLTLSGGQRQRVSIARAVLKNPPILILDEATSALDAESERAVQAALDSLMCGRTSIVIAHRLSTIQHADEILVMDKGRIVERGTHSQLIAQDGLYKKLVDMQSFV